MMEFWELFYYYFLAGMSILAVIIFIAIQFITPAYGITFNPKWGVSIRSNVGWMVMESPVFISMLLLFLLSMKYEIKPFNVVTFTIFLFFQVHYIERSFIFPLLMKGNSRMPISIIILGFFFNSCNAFMQGGWLFFFSPEGYYPLSWFWSWQFIVGTVLFITGMVINLHSDSIIRHLRKNKNDNNYYIPYGGFFKYVSSANYFGEILEWIGFAILSWSMAGVVFVLWSLANIVPRAAAVYKRYSLFFGEEFTKLNRYKIFPFIY